MAGGVQDAPKGPRPEKVKYPGMGRLVLSSQCITIALNYISGVHTIACGVLIYIRI